jgi:hypothetical protein
MFARATPLSIAACILASSVAAQTSAPTLMALDGKYAGTATESRGRLQSDACETITSVDMTVTGGQVVTHEITFNGHTYTQQGTVNEAGEVSAVNQRATLSGTVHDRVFAGRLQAGGGACAFSIQMQKEVGAARN